MGLMWFFIGVPAEKVELPVGAIALSGFLTWSVYLPVSLIMVSGFLYLVNSAANGHDSKRDDLITLGLIFLALLFLSTLTGNFIRYQSSGFCLASWIAFLIPALVVAFLSIKRLQKRKPSRTLAP